MNFNDVRDLYQDVILNRSRNPRHMHSMDVYDAKASGDNPMCGDQVEVRLRFADDGRVEDAAFEARGCAISMASADLMAESVRGLSAEKIRALAGEFVSMAKSGEPDAHLGELQVLSGVAEYPSRVKCATLPWAALVAALDQHQGVNKHG